MRHSYVQNWEKQAQVFKDEYQGSTAHSSEDHFNCPLSPTSHAEFLTDGSGRKEQPLSQYLSVKPKQTKKKKKSKDSSNISKLEEEDSTKLQEEPTPSRGRRLSREDLDIQFDMEPEDSIKRPAAEATPVRQAEFEIVSTRVDKLKISERMDRSVSPQKQLKSKTDSPSATPRQGVSPAAASRRTETTTPSTTSASKRLPVDVNLESTLRDYNDRQEGRDLLNLVVVGHVDAGKSTLMGHLLVKLNVIDERTLHKNKTEAARLGKDSFSYAFVLDESEEERKRGITMDIAHAQFKTATKIVNLVDAPGHKDFIPNMIDGATQADVAILVVDSRRGEFETGFNLGGQTREHAILLRSLGISQLICAINKMDVIAWSQERFDDIVKKLSSFLKVSGFKESDVVYVPVSGWTGENLERPPKEPLPWYTKDENTTSTPVNGLIRGATLVDLIDRLKPPERPVSKPFRLCINDIFRGSNTGASTISISGRIDAGAVKANDRALLRPSNDQVTVKAILIDNNNVSVACAGENAILHIQGVDPTHLFVGNFLCHPSYPVPCVTTIEARVIIFNINSTLLPGTPIVFHFKSIQEPAKISALVEELNRSTGELVRKNPRMLRKNTSGLIRISFTRPICCELYSDFKELGRFTIRDGGMTMAAGFITRLFD